MKGLSLERGMSIKVVLYYGPSCLERDCICITLDEAIANNKPLPLNGCDYNLEVIRYYHELIDDNEQMSLINKITVEGQLVSKGVTKVERSQKSL